MDSIVGAGRNVPSQIVPFVQQTTALIFFLGLDLILGISNAFLNGMSLAFYRTKITTSTNVNHLLYFFLSLLGVIIGIGCFLHVVILLFTISYSQTALDILIPVAFFVILISTYVATMVNVCLSVIRTIRIVRPFYRIRRRGVVVSIVVYGMLWLGVATADVYYWSKYKATGEEYFYCFINMSGALGLINIFHRAGLARVIEKNSKILPFLIWGVPCVIPSLICLTCSLVQLYSLRVSRQLGRGTSHKKVTITILLLTMIFFFCNTLSFTYCIAMILYQWKGYEYYLGLYTVTCLVPFVNTLLNPIILISRGHQLKAYVVGILKERRVVKVVKDHQTTMSMRLSLSTTTGGDGKPGERLIGGTHVAY